VLRKLMGESERGMPLADGKLRYAELRSALIDSSEARALPLPSVVVAMLGDMKAKTGKVFDGSNLRTGWEKACATVGWERERNSKAKRVTRGIDTVACGSMTCGAAPCAI